MAHNKFGDELISMPSHKGNDVYRYGTDVRVSAPGTAHYRTQEIEDYIQNKIKQTA
jgi:hypothetical protein